MPPDEDVKKITVLIRGTGKPQLKDISIVNGTSPTDLKRDLDIPIEYKTFNVNNKEFIDDENANLFAILEQHNKLEFSPPMEVGIYNFGVFL